MMRLSRFWWTAVVALAAVGCESVNHENIDRWRRTEKGPGKLEKALASSEHDADLRAHAAQNLVQIDRFDYVESTLSVMDERERVEVMEKLVPRLWEDARIEGELTVPTLLQTGAKDALFNLRGVASDKTRETIDIHLVDWLTGGYYEGRASQGVVQGASIVRAVGPVAAPKLIESVNSIIARGEDEEGKRARIGDSLLMALALSSDSEALKTIIKLIKEPRGDDSLPGRAMKALYGAYVDATLSGAEVASGKALVPIADELAAIAKDENYTGAMNNDAVDLIAAMGMPECLPPFVEMVSYAHSQISFRYMGAQRGIRCGGAAALVPVLEGLPPTGAYQRGILERYIWDEAIRAGPKGKLAEAAKSLLESNSWVARASAIEILGKIHDRKMAAEHAVLIRRLASDKTRLRGWYGEDPEKPEEVEKPDPTLGAVASEVASRLEELAKGAETK